MLLGLGGVAGLVERRGEQEVRARRQLRGAARDVLDDELGVDALGEQRRGVRADGPEEARVLVQAAGQDGRSGGVVALLAVDAGQRVSAR